VSPNAASPVSTTGGGERNTKEIFLGPGVAQLPEKAQSRRENPRKFKPFYFDFLCPALAGFCRVGEIARWLCKKKGLYRSAADRDGGRIATSARWAMAISPVTG
jgi:hypothetical protein